MCKRLMGNLTLLGSVRKAYFKPFHYHPTKKHKTQSSFPDVIKGFWFCLCRDFFKVSPGKISVEYPIETTSQSEKKVFKSFICIVEKGEQKVKDKFKEKLHECFPSYRLTSLEGITAGNVWFAGFVKRQILVFKIAKLLNFFNEISHLIIGLRLLCNSFGQT